MMPTVTDLAIEARFLPGPSDVGLSAMTLGGPPSIAVVILS